MADSTEEFNGSRSLSIEEVRQGYKTCGFTPPTVTLPSRAEGHGSVSQGAVRFRRIADGEIAVRRPSTPRTLSGKNTSWFLSAIWEAANSAPLCHQREVEIG